MSDFYNLLDNAKLKYPFFGSEYIKETYSQAFQDIFVLTLLEGKENGKYLEIGCNVPKYTNNTYLLSSKFNWDGISIDFLSDMAYLWNNQRPNNTFLCCDATTCDYDKFLSEKFPDEYIIDYLQLDIDPPTNTLKALIQLPLQKYRFRVITFETDIYSGGESEFVREQSRQILSDLGYVRILSDVLVNGNLPYEDWWVDLNLVNAEIAQKIYENGLIDQNPYNVLLT
jgi:hypothetical protein